MADNIQLNANTTVGAILATDDDGTAHHQLVKVEFGADGTQTPVSAANPLPVTGPLTDTQLRATAVPVSGTVTASGPLTDAQLRASAVPVSAASLPLPAGAATEATLSTINGKVTACNTGAVTVSASALPTGAATSAAQLPDGHNVTVDNASIPITAAALPLPSGAATAANQLADGHNVTVDNASGAAAVNVQDGGNSLTVDNTVLSVVGGGTEATAQRVTIATDSTGVLSVDDNGGTLTVDNAALSVVGGGTQATALRVTVATDSTGVLSVDDNGASLTVDGTVTANAGTNLNTSALALEAGGNLATIAGDTTSIDGKITACNTGAVTVAASALPSGASTAANQATEITHLSEIEGAVETIEGTVATDGAAKKSVSVQVAGEDGTNAQTLKTDTDGHLQVDVLSGGGGGTQYAEDAAHTTGDTGTMALVVRNDSDASLCGTTGDYTPLQVDASGFLKVNIKAGAGSGGTAMTDDAAFTPGTTSVTPIAGTFDDTAPDSVDEGDAGAVRMSANRNLYSTIRDAAGNERGANVDASNQLTVADATAQGSLATIAGDTTSLDSKVTACNTGAVVVASGAITETNSTAILADTAAMDTNLATIAGDTTSLDSKVTACDTGAVTVAASALPTGAATAAKQLADGHNVTVDNGSGASAVNIQDGGNAITVDGTITETNSTAILADTAAMDTNLATIAGDTTSLDSKIAVVDIDSGAGTDNVQVVALKLATPGGGSGQVVTWVPCDLTPIIRGVPTVLYNGDSVTPLGTALNPLYTQGATGAASQRVQGTQDHDAADAEAPVKIGGKANAAEPAAVDEGDRVNAWFDLTGHQNIKVTSGAITETNSAAILADTAAMDTNLATIAGDTTSIDGKITACNTGAVVVSSGAITETNSAAIKNAVETIDNAIAGTEMQVDVVAALPAGTNAIGKLAANSGVDIGDVDVTSAPARVATTDAITAKLATDKIQNGLTACTPVFVSISAASSGDNTLVAAAGASNKIRVLSYTLIATGAVAVAFESGASGTALTGDMSIAATGGITCAFSPVGHFETAANTLLNLELSAAVQVSGHLTYIVVQ